MEADFTTAGKIVASVEMAVDVIRAWFAILILTAIVVWVWKGI